MPVNRGKKFEQVIREAFLKVPNTSVIRLPDPTQGYLGVRNISDFIVYHYPHQYFIECKSVHGNTLPFSNITDNQWNGLLDMAEIKGVKAGIICWWIDEDVTKFIPIRDLVIAKKCGYKSIRYDTECYIEHPMDELGYKAFSVEIKGKKKRIFFDYNMEEFFNEIGTDN